MVCNCSQGNVLEPTRRIFTLYPHLKLQIIADQRQRVLFLIYFTFYGSFQFRSSVVFHFFLPSC